MKKSKIILIVVLSVLVIAFAIVAILYIRKYVDLHHLNSGIYFFEHREYLAYCSDEEKNIYLDCYIVDETYPKGEMITDRYSDFYMIDADGNHYPIADTDADAAKLFEGRGNVLTMKTIFHSEIVFPLNAGNKTGSINLCGLHYKNEEGSDVIRDIGTVEIDILSSFDHAVKAESKLDSGESVVFPPFKEFEYSFSNESSKKAYIDEITFGNTGITAEISEKIGIVPGNDPNAEKNIPAHLPEVKYKHPVVYYLKPRITYHIDGADYQTAASNALCQKYYNFSPAECKELLYQIDKQYRENKG